MPKDARAEARRSVKCQERLEGQASERLGGPAGGGVAG